VRKKVISCKEYGEYYVVFFADKSYTVVRKDSPDPLVNKCIEFFKMRQELVRLIEDKN
jgi:hypothetical protein